jgi:hypothetical protein
VDPVARVPSEYGRLERRRVSGCPVEPLKLKVFVIAVSRTLQVVAHSRRWPDEPSVLVVEDMS